MPTGIKVIVFDADGMVIMGERFSTRFARKFRIPLKKINKFFDKEFENCLLGKKNLKKALAPYLVEWKYKGSIDSLLKFWFSESYRTDPLMLRLIAKLRKSGIICVLATNQEKYRAAYMKKEMGLKKFFDYIIPSSQIGYKKDQPQFLKAIAGLVPDIKKHEILFFDDRPVNVDAAADFGFRAVLFKGIEEFITIVYGSHPMGNMHLIILAAGKGKRMNTNLPKVLVPLAGKPLIGHLLEQVLRSSILNKPVIVVGHKADMVQQTLGPHYSYAHQKDQLGTGHAVHSARPNLDGNVQNIMVLYGDHPLIDSKVIDALADAHLQSQNPLTMATVLVDDFNEWRKPFMHFGRVVRDKDGSIDRIVEYKDATAEERKITEVNPSFFCFNANWLWSKLDKLNNDNKQGEYYLTDLVEIARADGDSIGSIAIDPVAALGANTREDLIALEKILKARDGRQVKGQLKLA